MNTPYFRLTNTEYPQFNELKHCSLKTHLNWSPENYLTKNSAMVQSASCLNFKRPTCKPSPFNSRFIVVPHIRPFSLATVK